MRILILLIVLTSINTKAAIYGTDDRTLIIEDDVTYPVLAQLAKGRYRTTENGVTLLPKLLKEHVTNLCPTEKFANLPSVSKCTSFLVGKDLMVTAGHCINSQKQCENTHWVLSQKLIGKDISNKYVVRCEKLLAHKKNHLSENDYALIKIKPNDNLPSPFLFEEENPFLNSQLGRSFFVLGHPNGLPLIHSGEAEVTWEESEFIFRMNSDTFGGNSGSPVIDSVTGNVFGILTNGDQDYQLDHERGCLVTHKCKGNCKGENIVPLFNIPELVPGPKSPDPIFDPRIRSL